MNPFDPIHVLASGLKTRELTAAALVDAYLGRIRRLDSKLHAYAEVYEREARAAAERADARRDAGKAMGTLDGIPIAFKDLLHIEGKVSRGGSVGADQHPDITATVVRRLTGAGMIALGKTHMVEAAFGSWGTNTVAGAPWNPWDLATHRVPGGSSSGSGVAVSAGLAPAAIGSDTGGSIRIPASLCGIVGLKATVGRVSNFGAMMLSDTLDTLGPMTRDVEDAALIFDAIHGPDANDARTLAHQRTDVLRDLKNGIRGMRFGMLPAEALGEIDAETSKAFEHALEVLRSLGATIVAVAGPATSGARPEATAMDTAADGYARLPAPLDSNEPPMDADVRKRLDWGRKIPAFEYIRILEERRRLAEELESNMKGCDALVTPTTPFPAIPLTEVDQRVAPMSLLTRAVNLLDMCALALPCGFTDRGLPLSLQIVGRGYDEARVLRIGWAYEQATEWHTRTPQLA
jgi:aspartyl-tRNA(Asn)/glutamyl-tRNA(Gln) amidotransferase subunit A